MLKKRGNKWYLNRRVPTRYHEVTDQRSVVTALSTESREVAHKKALAVWEELIEGWEALIHGDYRAAEHRLKSAKNRAKVLGYRYLSVDRVADLPLPDLLERVDKAIESPKDSDALLGNAEEPRIRLSNALDMYWTLAEDKLAGKSEDQMRRHTNARKRAFSDLIEVTGDLVVSDLTRDDAMDFRNWLAERIRDGDISPATANKQFTYVMGVLNRVSKLKGYDWPKVFSGLTFDEGIKKVRLAFSTGWIRDEILRPGALDGLNSEAATILKVLINTGCRPSEVVSLRAHHVDLDGEIPMIEILPEGKQLKTNNSMRKVPLAGVSLEALREYGVEGKEGPLFPRYADRDLISATLNKYMKGNGLKETSKHTLYGLRHSFEDRMIEAGVDERVRSDLFGHAIQRERYGDGGGDSVRMKAVQAVAL